MKRRFFQGVFITCTILLFLSCSKNSSSYGNPPPGGGNSNKVSISNMSFVASAITVTKGTSVTWTNNDYVTHTVTANDGSFNSSDLNYGNTYSYTFDSTGTFSYHCSIHPGMTGSVSVK